MRRSQQFPIAAAWAPERDALLARIDAAERQILFLADRETSLREKFAASASAARAREAALSRALNEALTEISALRGVRSFADELEKEAALLRGRLAAADMRAGYAERVAADAQRLLRSMVGEASSLAERARSAEESVAILELRTADLPDIGRGAESAAPRVRRPRSTSRSRRVDVERPVFDTRARYARPQTPSAKSRAQNGFVGRERSNGTAQRSSSALSVGGSGGAGGASPTRPSAILARLLRAVDGTADRVGLLVSPSRDDAAGLTADAAIPSSSTEAASGMLPVDILQRLLRAVEGNSISPAINTLAHTAEVAAGAVQKVGDSLDESSKGAGGGASSPRALLLANAATAATTPQLASPVEAGNNVLRVSSIELRSPSSAAAPPPAAAAASAFPAWMQHLVSADGSVALPSQPPTGVRLGAPGAAAAMAGADSGAMRSYGL